MAINVIPFNNPALASVSSSSNSAISQAMQFYLNDRPSDWLKIPDPASNEIYYLVQFDTEEDDIGINIAGRNLAYSILNADGTWAESVPLPSSENIIITFQYDSNRHLTSDNKCQYLIKFSGTAITSFRHCGSTFHPAYNVAIGLTRPFFNHNILEIKVNAPAVIWFCLNIPVLRYISFYSTMNNIVDNVLISYSVGIFSGSTALKAIIGFNAPKANQLSYLFPSYILGAFQSCTNLKYVDALVNPLIFTNAIGMFSDCNNLVNFDIFNGGNYGFTGSLNSTFASNYKLKEFNQDGQYSLENVSSIYSTFYYCNFLKKVNLINTPSCTSFYKAFQYCFLLEEVLGINLSICTNTTDIFGSCYCLKRLIFAPNQSAAPNCSFDISASYAFTRSGLLELFNSLPVCTTSRTITLGSRSAGARELIESDIEIATSKGWSLNI